MRIAAISDLHGHLPSPIPECDLLLLCGDLCPDGMGQYEWLDGPFREWLRLAPARHIVATWGNHDFIGECVGVMEGARCTFLIDQTIDIDGCAIHGTPWSPPASAWAFSANEDLLAEYFRMIPKGLDILLTHCPPLGWHDVGTTGRRRGSRALLDAVQAASPQMVICGHVHDQRGCSMAPWGQVINVSAMGRNRVLRANPFWETEGSTRTMPRR
jgi:Icc-related predicted phosphoesterase